MRSSNRIVTWTEEGKNYKAHQRHARIIIRQLRLKGSSDGLSTPGNKADAQGQRTDVSNHDATQYRGLVARANYLSQGRTDIHFLVKELCRSMSSLDQEDWAALKRLGRHFLGRTRVIIKFSYQDR